MTSFPKANAAAAAAANLCDFQLIKEKETLLLLYLYIFFFVSHTHTHKVTYYSPQNIKMILPDPRELFELHSAF